MNAQPGRCSVASTRAVARDEAHLDTGTAAVGLCTHGGPATGMRLLGVTPMACSIATASPSAARSPSSGDTV